MSEILPIFPLKMVPFPGEKVNLHVFEPRYKDLVNDILKTDREFGIPPFINKKIEYGTLMHLTTVVKEYDDGRMDISTKGVKVFKIITFRNPGQDKKYAEAKVEFLENNLDEDPLQKNTLLDKLEEFFKLVNVLGNISLKEDIQTFDIVHKLGIPVEMEYEILKIERETDRQEYILNYLDKTIPIMRRVEKIKEIVKMNGHFKYFDPISF